MSDDEQSTGTETGENTGTDTEAETDHSIRALDTATIQRIAAGEVVERPASVVKELVENSLDADASRVSVAVDGDGTGGIRIRDDGVGMTESALRTAVEEHTTSKIRDIDDLEAGVGTLGFRGEALHTIGAVSRMTIRSKPRGGSQGTELVYEGGEVVDVRPAGCPEGTVVEVDDLFFNTPARRKFLKTEATEFDHVNTVTTQYALANPDVAVSLEHDDREVFATEGRGSLQSAVLSVYGREVAESMIAVDGEASVGAGTVAVSGLVSHPETTRSTRDYLSTFVNGRYVTAGVLREAVLDAYGGQLSPSRYPFAVLFLDVPSASVDVNVHPRKMEVRFDDEAGVRAAVRESIEATLLGHGLVRSSAPRGRSEPGETEIRPESPSSEAVAEPERRGSRTDGKRPERETDGPRATGPSEVGKGEPTGGASTTEAPATDGAAGAERQVTDGSESGETSTAGTGSDTTMSDGTTTDSATTMSDGTTTDSATTDESSPWRRRRNDETSVERSGEDEPSRETETTGRPHTESGAGVDTTSPSDDSTPSQTELTAAEDETGEDDLGSTPGEPRDGRGVVGPATQRTLAGGAVDLDRQYDRLPRMRVLGQLHETYIVAQTDEGLLLVDQHAADERVNYERLRRELEGETPTQALAEPVELELTAREAALFDDYQEALAQVGFHAGRVDDRTVEVRTVPAFFDATLDPRRLRDALAGFLSDERDGGRDTIDAAADDLISDLSCYPSVTGNTSLTEGSVVDLLEALDGCDNPYACPHGRPTILRIDRDEIEDRFERDYPGHAGRRRED